MFIEWVIGVLFRPAATFERAKEHLRFGYWWILLSVFTLEIVTELYRPLLANEPAVSPGDLIFFLLVVLMLLFDLQGLLLWGAARAFEWRLRWGDALKYVGLSWSVLLVEDIVTFYPALTGQSLLVLLLGLPFALWHLIILAIGIRQVTGLTRAKAWLMAIMATLPWRILLFWLAWQSIAGA